MLFRYIYVSPCTTLFGRVLLLALYIPGKLPLRFSRLY